MKSGSSGQAACSESPLDGCTEAATIGPEKTGEPLVFPAAANGTRRHEFSSGTQMNSRSKASGKRHSWASKRQQKALSRGSPDTQRVSRRGFSLDSCATYGEPLHGVPRIEAEFGSELACSPPVCQSSSSHSVHHNGEVMDLTHDPEKECDRTKYITVAGQQGDAAVQTFTGRRLCFPITSPSSPGSRCCSLCCSRNAFSNFYVNVFTRGKCSCKQQQASDLDDDDDIYIQDDPFRKRCLRAFLNFIYVLLAIIAVVVTYSMIQDLITAMNNPVRSIHYLKVKNYDAPGISMYPGGAKFLACGHYYNNVVTSKVRTSDLDLKNLNCTYTRLKYDDPHYLGVRRDVLVIRGPTSFEDREAIFLHFELEDESRDFFTVSYFVFPGWDKFNGSTFQDQIGQLTEFHRYMPTFALSAGLRMWIKLIMSETYLMDDTKHTEYKVENQEEAKHTEFNVEYSVVKFWDRRKEAERKKHLFFIFFEWKNNIIEQSYLMYTTTPWSIGAGLCGVFLTLHRGYQLAQIGYKRARKDKERRSIRKRTIRELKKAKSVEGKDGSANRKLRQKLSS